jgi:hypothetical protein
MLNSSDNSKKTGINRRQVFGKGRCQLEYEPAAGEGSGGRQ